MSIDVRSSSYRSIHGWLEKNYGKAAEHQCANSEKHQERLEWANIDGIYEKDINHFTVLCVTCHHRWDKRKYDPTEIHKKRKTNYSNIHPLQFYFPELAK